MNSWAPLYSGLVDSSIWEEADHVFRLFMAMMSLKDRHHIVTIPEPFKLARRVHMELPLVLDGLKVLSSPDTRHPGQEYEGRRIQAVDGGWLILNGLKYRNMVQLDMKRRRDRDAQANRRARLAGRPEPYPKCKGKRGTPLPGEEAFTAALGNGDEREMDRLTDQFPNRRND